MRRTNQVKQLVPSEVAETVCVVPIPRYSELSSVSFVDFFTMKRFNEEVKFTQHLSPVAYRDTIICFKDSTRKKFKSETHYEPRVKPRKFSDTLIVFPKKPQKGYVTILDYHIDECRRWFRTSMEFKAMTYTTRKVIMDDGVGEKGSEKDLNDNISRASDGPGASQIFLPRWNKDELEQSDSIQTQYPVLNSNILLNGY